MKLNFCTLFDSNYLTRGLAMHESLIRHCSEFHLYIFTFDNVATDILIKLNLQNVTVVTQTEFENQELLLVKSTRTNAEYCWTCTPSVLRYSIQKYNLDACTYLDADLFFYNNPKVLIEEMGSSSVLITEHRYTPEYDQSAASGKYCVQFITFKNDEKGMKILNWWRTECIKWCYARAEDGKFGDQKYLDDWTTRFEGVHELKHIGGGVAPWNLQQYYFSEDEKGIYLKTKDSSHNTQLIFFHFHDLKFFLNDVVKITAAYYIPKWVIKKIYSPYLRKLNKIKKRIVNMDTSFNPDGAKQLSPYTPYSFRDKIHLYKQSILKLNWKSIAQARKQILSYNYFYLNSIT